MIARITPVRCECITLKETIDLISDRKQIWL